MFVYACIFVCAYMFVCVFTLVRVCMYICVFACVRMCVCCLNHVTIICMQIRVLEITVGHWTFLDQIFGCPRSILIGQVYCIFSMGQQSITYKIFYLMYYYECNPTRVNSIHTMVICRHLIVLITLYTHLMYNQIH